MMSDTHSIHSKSEDYGVDWPSADIALHAGDFSKIGSIHEIRNFLEWYNNVVKAKHKVFIAGNHDLGAEGKKAEMLQLIESMKLDIIYLDNDSVTIEGIKIYGSPYTPSFGFGWAHNRDRGANIAMEWEKIPSDTDILITHGPALNHGDLTVRGHMHVGCADLLAKVEEINPRILLCGHIHEGYGIYRYKGDKECTTEFINASVLNAYYQPMNQPILVNYKV